MPARPLPSALRDLDVFTVEDADRFDVPRGRLFREDIRRPHRGIRSLRTALTLEDRCRDYLPRMRPDRFFSHTTAARLHGLPLPKAVVDADTALHVTVLTPGQPPRAKHVVGHRAEVRPNLRTTMGSLPVATAEEAWCALGEILSHSALVMAGDHFVRKGVENPAQAFVDLRATVWTVRRRHTDRLDAALGALRPGVRSPMESLLRMVIVQSGLPEPVVNGRTDDHAGGFLSEGDLVYYKARFVIEYEGAIHREETVWMKDIRRRERMEDAGWRVLRVTKDDLFAHRSEMLQRIRTRLTDAGVL